MARVRAKRTQEEVEENLRILRLVGKSWIADAAILVALCYLSSTSFSVPVIYLATALTYVSVVYIAMRHGYTERFGDPTLTYPQLIISVCNQCLGLWLAPQIGVFFLFNIFRLFAYGSISLTVRQFKALLFIAGSLPLIFIISAGHLISFPVETMLGRILLCVTFISCLARYVWVGIYVTKLRKGISAKNAALSESEARFRALTELSSDWYWEQDVELRFRRMESGAENKVMPQDALIGKLAWESDFSVELEGGWDDYREMLARHVNFHDLVMKRVSSNNQEYFVSLSGGPIFDREGGFKGYRGVAREITAKRLSEDRLKHIATHDELTGLPNRLMFNQLLDATIETSRRYGHKLAVLFVDLDRFKLINDTLGHEAGDMLLKEVSMRFKQNLRASDIIARLGGDEFIVLVPELKSDQQAAAVARKLLAAAIQPFLLLGQECNVSASIGVAIHPDDAVDAQTLLKNADSAMYLAKEEGKNNYRFYSNGVKSRSVARMSLEKGLRHALARNEFKVHYQAKLDLKSGDISGVEALLRWDSPDLGSVPPVQFIHIAEETGLIIPIGKWVIQTACEQNMAWQHQGFAPICMAVNLSMHQFFDEHLLDDIAAILASTRMPAHLLELEITKSMVVHSPQKGIETLQAIRRMGVRLAIDDFGTGSASLAQLLDFPVDTLKVDQSFIRDLENKVEGRAITQAIIAMAKTLKLTVVAEGVETEGQQTFLRWNECDEAQGYFISKPIPSEQFSTLMRTYVARKSDAAVGTAINSTNRDGINRLPAAESEEETHKP